MQKYIATCNGFDCVLDRSVYRKKIKTLFFTDHKAKDI